MGASSKKHNYAAIWPLLGKYKTKDHDNVCLRLFIENSEELIFIKQNEPHPVTFATYLTKRQLESLLLVSITPKANNVKIMAHADSEQDGEIVNYYDDSINVIKNY